MYPANIRWVVQWYLSVHWVNQWHSSWSPVHTGSASVHWLRVKLSSVCSKCTQFFRISSLLYMGMCVFIFLNNILMIKSCSICLGLVENTRCVNAENINIFIRYVGTDLEGITWLNWSWWNDKFAFPVDDRIYFVFSTWNSIIKTYLVDCIFIIIRQR